MQKLWKTTLSTVSILWIGLFAYTLFVGESELIVALSAGIAALFLLDLLFIYRRSAGPQDFISRAWFDMLMLIPFLRVFRIGRIFRSARILRVWPRVRQVLLLERPIDAMEKFYQARGLMISGRFRIRRFW